jgi:hypothetical protein
MKMKIEDYLMNRDEALIKYNEIDKRVGIKPFWEVRDIIENAYNELELLQKENTRLKKKLSKDHHIECGCSFCKPVYEKQSCENCRHYDGTQTCNKFVARSSYNYKDFCCNKWELKC